MSPPPEPPAAAPRPWSLQARLRRRLLALLAGAWLLAAGSALVGSQIELQGLLDEALEDQARRLLSLPLDWRRPAAAQEDEQEGDTLLQLFSPEGRLLWRSEDAPAAPLAALGREGLRIEGRWRVQVEHGRDGRIAVAAEALADRAAVIGPALAWMLGPLLALLPLVALGQHLLLRRGFAALAPARAALARRDGRDLSPLGQDPALRRPDGEAALPQELAPLVEAVDALLGRLGPLRVAERQFAAASAHELRTPLAAARAQLQRLQAELARALPADHASHDRAATLARQLQHLGDLSAKLLQLARVDAGVGLAREPVALDELARLVLDEFMQAGLLPAGPADEASDAAAPPGWTLTLQPLTVCGDLDALGIALRNLIENSLRHGGPGVARRLSLQRQGGEVALVLEDEGPGAPPEQLARLRRPFERADRQAEGSGLGLALVEAVARQSGGQLDLASPLAPGRPGFRATLRLPAGDSAAQTA